MLEFFKNLSIIKGASARVDSLKLANELVVVAAAING